MNFVNQTSEELLLRYAAGQLRPAPALVVASHLAMSPSSRRFVAGLEGVGGAILDEAPMVDLSAGLFERTMAALDTPVRPASSSPVRSHEALDMGVTIPAPLARRSIGPWKWLGPGMRFARVSMPEDPDHNLILLRVPAGRAVPEHSHSGEECTVVLKGSFHDEGGRYLTGDLIHEDEETDHTPTVDMDGECICLTAIEGRMRIKGWMGRMVQPFLGL
ncbi:ChrR family anti-sigma-E factor [Rhizobium sp.]